ncbi:type II secretion system F family protein [Clostridium carnis]
MKIRREYPKYDDNNLHIIASNMAMLYDEGIPFLIIMDLLLELPLTNAYKNSITLLKTYVNNGMSLEDGLRQSSYLYPEFFISMIAVGEKSGRLTEVLRGIEEYYLKMSNIKKSIKSALSYPTLLLISIIVMIFFMIFGIIPSFYDFYISSGIEPPLICEAMYIFVNYIKSNFINGMAFIFCWGGLLSLGILNLLKYKKVTFVNKITFFRDLNEYILISLLSIIVKSGINLSKGLNYCEESFREVTLRKNFNLLNKNIINGIGLADSLEELNQFSSYSIAIIRLGEEGGSVDKRLESLSCYLERKTISKINEFLKLVEPVMIIVMAVIVVIFIGIFVLPLFNSLIGGI